MKFTLSDQMLCLGIGFLCGLMLGVLYDLFRFVRLVLFKGRISVFWTQASAVVLRGGGGDSVNICRILRKTIEGDSFSVI